MNWRKGSWMATDETMIDGRQFFLMVSEQYGRNAAYAVVDDQGRRAAEDTINGFDEKTVEQMTNIGVLIFRLLRIRHLEFDL